MSEEDEDIENSTAFKEFTLDFEKKLAKFIPPKIEYKSNLNNLSLITAFDYDDAFISSLKLFFGYLILNLHNSVCFYDKLYNLIFKYVLFKDKDKENEIHFTEIFEEDNLIIAASDKVRIVKFFEKEPKKITYEIIQEICDTEYYILNKILSNNYLILDGLNKDYVFYELENKNEKFSSNNKFKEIGKIEKIHNVYDDDSPDIIDLNNGRLLSWMNDDSNIKIVEYEPNIRILKSKNGYTLHNAGLISDKYICLMGLNYPTYYTWLMDTENFEIVKTFETEENNSFYGAICEWKFFCGSEDSFNIETIKIENGDFVKENLSKKCFDKKDDNWKESFYSPLVIDEKTFITYNLSGKIFIFKGE